MLLIQANNGMVVEPGMFLKHKNRHYEFVRCENGEVVLRTAAGSEKFVNPAVFGCYIDSRKPLSSRSFDHSAVPCRKLNPKYEYTEGSSYRDLEVVDFGFRDTDDPVFYIRGFDEAGLTKTVPIDTTDTTYKLKQVPTAVVSRLAKSKKIKPQKKMKQEQTMNNKSKASAVQSEQVQQFVYVVNVVVPADNYGVKTPVSFVTVYDSQPTAVDVYDALERDPYFAWNLTPGKEPLLDMMRSLLDVYGVPVLSTVIGKDAVTASVPWKVCLNTKDAAKSELFDFGKLIIQRRPVNAV